MSITSPESARKAADQWLLQNGGNFKYVYSSVRQYEGCWAVVFRVFLLTGAELDGPTVVRVDAHDGTVEPFYAP